MPDRPTVPLVFGPGMDRETGAMAVSPGSWRDLRNVLLHTGKVVLRRGFTSRTTLTDDNGDEISHVVAGHALRSERIGVVVGYQQSTQKVWVFRVSADGRTVNRLGEWTHGNGGWGSKVPSVAMAETFGTVFMAHDIKAVTKRAQTYRYDQTDLAGLTVDQADGWPAGQDGDPIRFRGVAQHLDYLIGWGWGDSSEDRPELVRISKPGAPEEFDVNAYAIAGAQKDPVVSCRPAADTLKVFKETETYTLFGTERRNFGIERSDPLYGALTHALTVNFSDRVIAWGAEGPRVHSDARGSQDIELPLDLDGLAPSDLATEGPAETAFAHYVPGERVILFVFGKRAYALTVRVPGDWKWSYWELGFSPRSAMTFVTGADVAKAPTGWPECNSNEPGGTYDDVTVDNVGQDGDEIIEFWLKPDGGSWSLFDSFDVSTDAQQTERLSPLSPGTDYDLAMRYRRGTLYTENYTVDDPDQWPSASKCSFTTTVDPPTLDSCTWSRIDGTTEQIELVISSADGQESQDIEIYRDDSLIATETPSSGQVTYQDQGISGETLHTYHFVTKGASADSPDSEDYECWAGPESPPSIEWAQELKPEWEARWTNGDASLETELHDDWDDTAEAVGTFPETLRKTVAAGVEQATSGNLTGVDENTEETITVGVRHKKTEFSVDDYSQFSTIALDLSGPA